jgi:hypothetical protein
MSLWVFVALHEIGGASDPPRLARMVQLANVAAIALLVPFALLLVRSEEREPWLWATALVAVNPLAVVLHRKIWPPSVFPIVSLAFLAAWWRRDRAGGSFAWGLVGAVLGQIEAAGYFFAAAFLLWTVIFDRRSIRWPAWIAGSVLGAMPLLPWLAHLWAHPGDLSTTAFHWTRPFELKFWLRWFTEPFGIGLRYSLGADFGEALSFPILDGRRTYLLLALHVLITAVAVVTLARYGIDRFTGRRAGWVAEVRNGSNTALAETAATWGFGGLLTATGLMVHRHHLLVAFPLGSLWLARAALPPRAGPPEALRRARARLASLVVLEAALTAGFLGYVHVNRGALHGDYGVAYGAQVARREANPCALGR